MLHISTRLTVVVRKVERKYRPELGGINIGLNTILLSSVGVSRSVNIYCENRTLRETCGYLATLAGQNECITAGGTSPSLGKATASSFFFKILFCQKQNERRRNSHKQFLDWKKIATKEYTQILVALKHCCKDGTQGTEDAFRRGRCYDWICSVPLQRLYSYKLNWE